MNWWIICTCAYAFTLFIAFLLCGVTDQHGDSVITQLRKKKTTHALTPEWELPPGLESEDLTWLKEQADLAEFRLPSIPRVRLPKPLELTGGTPVRFPTPSGLLEINGTWYQKFNSINGSYLKEAAAPPSPSTGEPHEESTTVRDFAGGVIVEHHLCECVNCSAWRWVPDTVRKSSRLATDQQHPGPVLPNEWQRHYSGDAVCRRRAFDRHWRELHDGDSPGQGCSVCEEFGYSPSL